MNEKAMVNDILNSCKFSLNMYQKAIYETEDMSLRQVIQQVRNNEESFFYELEKIAEIKEYCIPAEEAKPGEIEKIKNKLQ